MTVVRLQHCNHFLLIVYRLLAHAFSVKVHFKQALVFTLYAHIMLV